MSHKSPSPRGTDLSERESLRALVGTVFRPTLMEEYPQLFHDANLRNCRVVEVDGKLVSHVGLTVQDAAIFGCRVRVGCIGAVSTYEEYRGRGYASACFADAMRVAGEQGCDFMMISGYRSLYHRAGCRYVGQDYSVTMTAAQAKALAGSGLTRRAATVDDIPAFGALHRAEPLHWKRPPDTWRRAFECGWAMNRFSEFWLLERERVPHAYFIVPKASDREKTPRLTEFAGNREHLLAAFADYVLERGLPALSWHLAGTDAIGRALAHDAGLDISPTATAGTCLIVQPAQLLDRLRPYLSEFVGEETAMSLRLVEESDAFVIRLDDEEFSLPDRGALAEFFFGKQGDEAETPTTGRLAEVYCAAFPIPALWYGINYV